jgi:hydroxymethylglutaryl-CoA lyase
MNKIEIYEVGPRDGFQNIPEYIPLETKLTIIEKDSKRRGSAICR